MPYSHHSHSGQFCRHASGMLEDVVREAIKQGFQVYGLTEHVPRYRVTDLYPEEEGISLDDLATQFDAFLVEAHRLKHLYANDITLLIGLETEFISDTDLSKLEECLQRYGNRIEYLVGSVHHVNSVPIDFDASTYQRALDSLLLETSDNTDVGHQRMETLLCAYFDAQYQILTRFHPEVVGHIDICRLYNPSLELRDYPPAWAKLERNVRYAIEYGALFELNAAAFRKGWDAAYPGEDVLAFILQNDGRFALSDDSHGPHAVGLNYHRLEQYIRRAGIQELWVLRRSDSCNAGGRYLHPVKVERWWEHPFWGHRDVAMK